MSADEIATDDPTLPLRTAEGGFAMLALDQRESLRQMFAPADGREVGDDELRTFKRAAMSVLTPFASAVLLDRLYGVDENRPVEVDESCALILAADVLHHGETGGVDRTTLDPEVTAEYVRSVGASALKLLVIWRRDGQEAERAALVRSFLDVAAEAGVVSLVEGIVRPAEGDWKDPGERHTAILDAARELSSYGGTIYKAEVPGYVQGDLSRVREQAERMTELVDGPWVVLSNGVAQLDFAEAVGQACAGGASGFLAGRAIWADTVSETDHLLALTRRSVDRLNGLREIVASTLRG